MFTVNYKAHDNNGDVTVSMDYSHSDKKMAEQFYDYRCSLLGYEAEKGIFDEVTFLHGRDVIEQMEY